MNIFRMDIRRSVKQLIIWSGVSGAIIALIILLYPTMMNSDFMELLNAKLELLPKELIDAFNFSSEDIRELPQYFASMYQFVLMAACIFGAIIGVSTLSREHNEGTIEFLIAKPARRVRIVSAKLAAAGVQYLIYFAVFSLAAIIALLCVKPANLEISALLSSVATVMLGGFITGCTFLLLGFAISAVLKRARNAVSMAVALFFLTYILGTISTIGVLPFLKWISPMTYFVPTEVLSSGINGLNVLICALIMTVCAVVAYTIYNKKDITV